MQKGDVLANFDGFSQFKGLLVHISTQSGTPIVLMMLAYARAPPYFTG